MAQFIRFYHIDPAAMPITRFFALMGQMPELARLESSNAKMGERERTKRRDALHLLDKWPFGSFPDEALPNG